MVLGFLGGWALYAKRVEAEGGNRALAEQVTFWAAIGGFLGARVLYVLSNMSEFGADPLAALFSTAGFIFYGGFLGGALGVILTLRRAQVSVAHHADLIAPSLSLAYAIGRIGCQLAGDGDYGIQSMLPWAVSYALGVVPTEPGVRVHPTPVYETIGALVITWLLVKYSGNLLRRGRGALFAIYLILSAVARFSVEFLRIEPEIFYGLTQAQLFAIFIFGFGLFLWRRAVPREI